MKFFVVCAVTASLILLVTAGTGCGKKATWQEKADTFLEKYIKEYQRIYVDQAQSYWKATNSGKKEDFDAYANADLELKKLHSDNASYKEIETILAEGKEINPNTLRSLKVAELDFKGNQLPAEILEKMTQKASEIEQLFQNFRGKLDDKEYTDNELKALLKEEVDSAKRQKIWEALKQVGDAVAPKLIELAKIRNEAAASLGFQNYWDMQIRLQEHDPQEIMAIFGELEKTTNEPFKAMKDTMDAELAARFKIEPAQMMPWHYDSPFFQEPPPSSKLDWDIFYKDNKKEDIIEFAKTFFNDIGLPIEEILTKSDLYEREGKQQHAFSIDMDHLGDARILVNIQANAYWMDTLLHEMGHALYTKHHDQTLPFNLRDAAHAFTTEGVAQLFGALAKNPMWIKTYTGYDAAKVDEAAAMILDLRRREQLIFARWSLVMLNFEKAFYENPDQDLNTLWWDMVERYQMLKRPEGRNAADWASKIHFTIAPVYYHNYMLGELFAAQMRAALVKLGNHEGPANTLDYKKHPEFGEYFKNKIFKPGKLEAWPEFVKSATGEALTAKYFADELK